MRCEEPMKIIELLRLWEQGYTQREIAASINCSKTTVAGLQKRLKETGLSGRTAGQERARLGSHPEAAGGKQTA